jgi:putative transposase
MVRETANASLEDVPQALWELATTREAVIKPLALLPRVGLLEIDIAARQLNLKRSSVYSLRAAYRKRPQTTTLLPGHDGRKKGTWALEKDIESLIESTIDEFYLSRERPRFSDLMREMCAVCRGKGLRAPDYRTLKRRIKSLDKRRLTSAREGSKRARERFAPVLQHDVGVEPLAQVQIDHTRVDVIVVDSRQRRALERPWLTLAIDVPTRVVAGYHLTMEAPSALSVAILLANAVLPKGDWLADRAIGVSWPVFGLPEVLYLDNAKEFHSQALMRGAQEYGMKLEYRPRGAPHFGGHVERLIGTFMGKAHLLPGTTFSNVRERDQYDSEKAATMTLEELESWLLLEMEVYHNSVHSALKKPPIAAWTEGLAKRAEGPRLPADAIRFFRDFLPGERRLIRRDGIRMFNINYWGNVLSPLAGRSPDRVLVKYDPRDLSHVYYQDEKGQYWPIPYRDLRQPRISLWEHRDATNQLRIEGRKLVDEQRIFEAVKAQRSLISAAKTATRRCRELESQRLRSGRLAVSIESCSTQTLSTLRNQKPEPGASFETDALEPFAVEDWS